MKLSSAIEDVYKVYSKLYIVTLVKYFKTKTQYVVTNIFILNLKNKSY